MRGMLKKMNAEGLEGKVSAFVAIVSSSVRCGTRYAGRRQHRGRPLSIRETAADVSVSGTGVHSTCSASYSAMKVSNDMLSLGKERTRVCKYYQEPC